ncbi:unnamed protein product, partial [Ectocarpus fasciculatus]
MIISSLFLPDSLLCAGNTPPYAVGSLGLTRLIYCRAWISPEVPRGGPSGGGHAASEVFPGGAVVRRRTRRRKFLAEDGPPRLLPPGNSSVGTTARGGRGGRRAPSFGPGADGDLLPGWSCKRAVRLIMETCYQVDHGTVISGWSCYQGWPCYQIGHALVTETCYQVGMITW